jgi:hypothetical protein
MQPEERVKAFIADFHRAQTELKRHPDDHEQFDRWSELVAALDTTHFVDRGGLELANVIHGGESPHILEAEPIVNVKRTDECVFVETRVDEAVETFYEYELREVSTGDWRIARLREFLDPADAPFMDEDEREEFEHAKIHPLRKLSAEEADADGDKLFAAGRAVKLEKKKGTIDVRSVGTLSVTTGILVVGDLAYGPYVLSPAGLRVPPGNYPAEVAIAFGRNLALRVRLSDHMVVKWHPADMGESGGHVIGVDAGNAAIMDLAAIATLNARDKERIFDLYARASGRPRSLMLSLVGANDTVVADSGWGDGSYPVYWGVDAHQQPAVLLVDFRLLPN